MQRLIEAIITERLIHRFNPELRFELITPDASDPDDIRKDQMQAKRDNILTADEVRADSFDKDPLEVETEETPTEEEQTPDTDATDAAEDAPQTTKAIRKALTDDELSTLADSRADQMDALADGVEPSVIGYFTAQEQRLVAGVADTLILDNLEGYVTSDSLADTTLHALLFGALLASLTAGVQAAQLQVGITLGFNQTNPQVQSYLASQALQHAKGINQTTRDQLRVSLSAGIQAGEGIDLLKARVASVFTEAKGWRAITIARTETSQAFGYANHAALRVMFEEGVINARTWLTAQDDRVRPTHAELHGYTVRFGEAFPGGIEPGQEFNCRCSEIGVVDGALT
jgi:SPP1 gp7 family putative phage head morphogenesis protein